MVRAFNPAPGAWFVHHGERLRVHAAETEATANRDAAPGTVIDERLSIATGSGIFRPTSVQRAGRPRMPVDAFLRGFAIPPGTLIG